jgi:hypothetical protein
MDIQTIMFWTPLQRIHAKISQLLTFDQQCFLDHGTVSSVSSGTGQKTFFARGSQVFGQDAAQFSRLLKNHSGLAVYNLNQLSKKQAKQLSKAMKYLDTDRLPWKVAVIIDSTFQNRSTLHTDNAKKFNHGKGYVIGHQ